VLPKTVGGTVLAVIAAISTGMAWRKSRAQEVKDEE
jgi:hypothetical protein